MKIVRFKAAGKTRYGVLDGTCKQLQCLSQVWKSAWYREWNLLPLPATNPPSTCLTQCGV